MHEHGVAFAEDLDPATCGREGCNCSTYESEIFFHSRCHPDVPTWVAYRAGVLSVVCAKCGAHVCSVAVAQRATGGGA